MTAARLSNPSALNLYAYARNNPLKFVDPLGREVRMASDTEEGRKRALVYQQQGMSKAEAANVSYHKDKNGNTVMYIRDASAVDMSKASTAYKELAGRIGSSTVFNYGVVGGGLTATFAGSGQVSSWSKGGSVGQGAGGQVNVMIDKSVDIKTTVFDANGGEVLAGQLVFLTAIHELLGETLKYTEGHSDLLSDKAKDNVAVIGIENAVRQSLTPPMPLRTGSDHYHESGTEALTEQVPYDPSPMPTRLQ